MAPSSKRTERNGLTPIDYAVGRQPRGFLEPERTKQEGAYTILKDFIVASTGRAPKEYSGPAINAQTRGTGAATDGGRRGVVVSWSAPPAGGGRMLARGRCQASAGSRRASLTGGVKRAVKSQLRSPCSHFEYGGLLCDDCVKPRRQRS